MTGDSNRYKDLIPAYLAGQVSTEDRRSLEARLSESEALRQELAELQQLNAGLTILDTVAASHIDSELLARYAADPSAVPEDIHVELEVKEGVTILRGINPSTPQYCIYTQLKEGKPQVGFQEIA